MNGIGHWVISHKAASKSTPCGGFRIEKRRRLVLGSSDAYQRNNFNMPRILHLSIHRKTLKWLTQDVLWHLVMSLWMQSSNHSFVISSNLLMLDKMFCFFAFSFVSTKTPIYWLFPYLFGTFPQSFLRRSLSQPI